MPWRRKCRRRRASASSTAPRAAAVVHSMSRVVCRTRAPVVRPQAARLSRPMVWSFQVRAASRARATPIVSRRSWRAAPGRNSRDAARGMTARETTVETPTARQMVSPASPMKRTIREEPEPRKKKGMKTHIVVRAEARTAMPTSRVPETAASTGPAPSSSRRRKIDSRVTTAGSTSMPTASMSPTMETMLRVIAESKSSRAT